MLHMFHTCVVTLFLNVSSVSDVCYIQCFMLQVFYGDTVSDGRMTQASGIGRRELGAGGQGCSKLGLAPGPVHV
jgi:hypothetical protein